VDFFSKKEIATDEELTINYNFHRYGEKSTKCYCGTAKCNKRLDKSEFKSVKKSNVLRDPVLSRVSGMHSTSEIQRMVSEVQEYIKDLDRIRHSLKDPEDTIEEILDSKQYDSIVTDQVTIPRNLLAGIQHYASFCKKIRPTIETFK